MAKYRSVELTPFENIMRDLADIRTDIENSPTARRDWALASALTDLTSVIANLAIALKPLLTSD